jgi:ferrous iron transport protein B
LKSSSSPKAPARVPLVALVGNPNAGKTTIFNELTGSHQKVGNYAGVTVEKVSATLRLPGVEAECIDVPGLYSLRAVSEDERVALEVVEGDPDVLVCVLDGANLERNLYLYSQLAELGKPIVVALTMVDRLPKSGRNLDLVQLTAYLGAPVVPVIGRSGKGLEELRNAIAAALQSGKAPEPRATEGDPLEAAIESLRERFARQGMDFSAAEVRRALLRPTPSFDRYVQDFPEIREPFEQARDLALGTHEVSDRYRWAAAVQRAVLSEGKHRGPSLTDRIDKVLTNKVAGLAVFVALMYLVFLSIYTLAIPLMDGIEAATGWLQTTVGSRLETAPWLHSLIVDGLIGGVGAVLVFLPQILILFFFIAMLEGTGYLARAAFLMDRLLGWCGLNGRAFIPLLSSFACAIPGIMAARVMPDQKSRLATILVAPLMSCSARLPVYVLLISAFVFPEYGAFWAGFALFAMHFLGLFVAVPIVWALNRKVIKGQRLPFLLELPPYQWPKWRDVWIAMYFRGRVFVQTAGTIIVAMSIVIWALSYFPRIDEPATARLQETYAAAHPQADEAAFESHLAERQLEQSYLGRFGKSIEPVFLPAGFDWRITTSILAAFPARETVVPSLGIIFSLGGDVDEESPSLVSALSRATWPDGRPLFNLWNTIGLMVFFALCAQCMATLATVKRETNTWKWPVFMFTYMTALAYIGAVLIYQLGRMLG